MECINSNILKRSDVQVNKITYVSIFMALLFDNTHILSFKYHLLES